MAHEGKRHGFAGSGNSQIYTTGSVADKLSELKASEASFIKFKPLPSMTVDAGQVSDFVQKLETEKSNNNINLVQSQKGRIDSQEDRLKPFSNDGISSLASINPSDYASMGSGGPGTADDDQRVHKAAYVAQQIKNEFAKGINFNGEKSNTSDIPAEYVFRGEAEGGGDLYLASNGKSYADVLKEYKAANGEEVSGAFFTKGVSDILGSDRDSEAQRDYLTKGTAVFSDGSYEATEGRDFHAHLAEKAETEAKAKAQLDRFETILDRQDDEKNNGEKQAKRKLDEMNLEAYKKQKAAETEAAAIKARENRKIANEKFEEVKKAVRENLKYTDDGRLISDLTNEEKSLGVGLTDSQKESIYAGQDPIQAELQEAAKKEQLRELEKAKNAHFLSDEKLIETAKKVKEEKEAKLHNKQINNPTADDIAGESQLAKDKAALRKQMQENAQRTLGNDSAFANPVEKTKIPDKYPTMGDKSGNPDLLVGKDPFRFSTLAYPMNITVDEEYGHYMLFYVNVQNKTGYKYLGYNDDDNLAIIGDVVESQTYTSDTGTSDSITETTSAVPEDRKYKTNYHYNTGANNEAVAYHKQSYLTGKKGNFLQSNQVTLKRQRKATAGLAAAVPTTSRITDSVAIYLPSDVQSDIQATYNDSEMGLLGFLALGGADVINQIKERDFEGAADNFLGMGERALSEMIKKAGIAAVGTAFGTSGTTEVFNKIFGQTPNPFLEVAFQNLGLRKFDYTFNFKPRSAEETEEVKAIIQLFRFHMAPELRGTNHRYMTLPSTFDIHYMYQSNPESATENTFYNKIATCVLTGCAVNYTPTGVKSFESGAPTEITMALSFKETELLTKQKINKGF